jgi:tRNA threonylcarbamoyladenosine biosynthesis protein TsaB
VWRQLQAVHAAVSLVLAIDCAVTGLGVAVLDDATCLIASREPGRDQAARLLPAVATTLAHARVDRRSLSLVAITVGPGSFTGVRVGLAAARGLALALDVPLAGLATTTVLLAQVSASDRLAVAAIDSQLGDWFCALAEGESDAPFLASTQSLADRLRDRACLIVGPEAERLAAELESLGIGAQAQPSLPDPIVLGRLALAQGIESWRLRNRREGLPRPLYLRGVSVTLPDGVRRTVD